MEYYRQTINSDELSGVFNLPPLLRNKKVDVIVLPAEDSVEDTPKPKRRLGFVKAPPLPDSFFDPLPEEELQLWGL